MRNRMLSTVLKHNGMAEISLSEEPHSLSYKQRICCELTLTIKKPVGVTLNWQHMTYKPSKLN